jgi:hypothetical protein
LRGRLYCVIGRHKILIVMHPGLETWASWIVGVQFLTPRVAPGRLVFRGSADSVEPSYARAFEHFVRSRAPSDTPFRLIPVALQDLNLHPIVMPQAPRASTPTEVLAGLVERVTFHNEENGFCVLRVKARGQRDLITVLGHAAMIAAGEFVQASGSWINDRTHGVQFRASFLKAAAPTTIEGIEKYLGSGMIRGIGPIYARSWSAPLAMPCSTS